jgi:hypothetical protein
VPPAVVAVGAARFLPIGHFLMVVGVAGTAIVVLVAVFGLATVLLFVVFFLAFLVVLAAVFSMTAAWAAFTGAAVAVAMVNPPRATAESALEARMTEILFGFMRNPFVVERRFVAR